MKEPEIYSTATILPDTREKILSSVEITPIEEAKLVVDKEATWAEDSKRLANARFSDNSDLRKLLSFWTIFVVSTWLLLVMVILIGNTKWFELSDSVLIALLTTTTLNIVGLSYVVLHGLFGGNSDSAT